MPQMRLDHEIMSGMYVLYVENKLNVTLCCGLVN